MIVIELRQAAKDKAFDLLDEIKDLGHKKKMAICELEETLYDCFESSEEDDEEYESDEYMSKDDEDDDIDYRSRRSYRYDDRHAMLHRDMHKDDETDMRFNGRRNMRMRRRNRMGRFV